MSLIHQVDPHHRAGVNPQLYYSSRTDYIPLTLGHQICNPPIVSSSFDERSTADLCLLYISTSIWLLNIPNTGRNVFFQNVLSPYFTTCVVQCLGVKQYLGVASKSWQTPNRVFFTCLLAFTFFFLFNVKSCFKKGHYEFFLGEFILNVAIPTVL